jgi:hypothetical protein
MVMIALPTTPWEALRIDSSIRRIHLSFSDRETALSSGACVLCIGKTAALQGRGAMITTADQTRGEA